MSDQEKLAAEADKLHNEMKLEDVYKLLVDHKDSDNPELLWRFARACREYGLLPSTSSKVKRSVAYEAVESAKKAVSVDDQSSQCHKWYGISLVESGDYDGVKKKISNSYIIKEHFLKALQLDPTDASCMHLVGRWCFTFADMPWYQQKIASAIFGKPPTSTFEEALEYFDRGEKADPGFYSVNQLYLGKTHIKMKDTQSAITWLTKLKDFPGTKEEDKNAKKEAVDLLKTLGVK